MRDPGPRTVAWLLVGVLAVGLGLRLWMALVVPRYFDDRYIFNNIGTFLDGSLRPRHSYYGSLSYLPQALTLALCDFLHSLTGIDALAVRGKGVEGFTLGAFRIMRMFVVAYALASILMIYFVGRRLFSPTVGLAAAAVLAAYPQHLRSSIQLKPDMMALMFTVITLYWTAGAARNPRLARFLLAGVGVGLATSAKYIGVGAALPLAVWAVWSGFRDRRRWAWLVLSGVASVVTFFALNPFFGTVFYFSSRLVKFYGNRARWERSDRLVVLRDMLEFLGTQHGWILGAFLLLGTALLGYQLWRKPEGDERTAALLPLSLWLGYPAAYAVGMTLFRTHNLLPAMAGMALVGAYGMVHGGRWLAARPVLGRAPGVALVGWALAAGLLLVRPFNYAYTQLVPSTWAGADLALRARLEPVGARHVAYEPATARLGLAAGWHRAAKTAVPSLASLPPSGLDLTDAEVFPLSRSQGPQADFYRQRRQRWDDGCVQELHARPFHLRGEPLLLLVHPWTPAGPAIPLALERSGVRRRRLVGRLPAGLTAGEILSIEIIRHADEQATSKVLLQPNDQPLPLLYAGRRLQRTRFLTPRFRYATGMGEIQVPASAVAAPKSFRLKLWRWARPACS